MALDREAKHAFNAKVGARVRAERKARGWSQEALAGAAGLSPNYVALVERGDRGMGLATAKRMAEALGVRLEVLAS